MVMDTTSSTGRWLSAERATKMFDRLSNLGATYVELRAMSCDSNVVRLRDGSMDAAVPAQDLGVTLRVLADGAWGVHSTTDLDSVYAQGEETLRVARAVAARRPAGEPQVELAEVPAITDEVVWAPKGDVRDLDLDARLDAMKAVEAEGKDDERIASVVTGWSDEHLRTEVLTAKAWTAPGASSAPCFTARSPRAKATAWPPIERVMAEKEGPTPFSPLTSVRWVGVERSCAEATHRRCRSFREVAAHRRPRPHGRLHHEALGHPVKPTLSQQVIRASKDALAKRSVPTSSRWWTIQP